MTYPANKWINLKKKASLNCCLAVLGADIKSIYANPYQYGVRGQHIPVKGSIYNRYDLDELHRMLDDLHKKAIKKHHHDLTGDEETMKEINWAVETGRRLLKKRGR